MEIDNATFDELMLDAPAISEQAFRDSVYSFTPKLQLALAVEFAFLARQPENASWPLEALSASRFGKLFADVRNRPRLRDSQGNHGILPNWAELLRCPVGPGELAEPYWTTFCMRVQKAAETLDLGKRFAQGIVGSLEELVSNAVEHSQHPTSAIVGYRSDEARFELVVADAGEGLLNSLRRAPEFSYLRNSDDALELALRDGISRFGSHNGRGHGFRQILRNLEFAGCMLRFRTGDFVLCMQPGATRDTLSYAANYSGFLMSISVCRHDFSGSA